MMSLLWDSPDAPVRASVVVLHGFARSARNMAGIAGFLANRGCLTVRPSIPSFTARRSLHDPVWLDDFGVQIIAAVRERALGMPLIGIGHSAGGAVVAGWSDHLDGLLLLDPVDRHHRVRRCAADPRHPPVRVITADPSACNRHGRTVRMLADVGCVEPGRTWTRIDGTSHPDPERVPATGLAADVPDPDPLARLACGSSGSATLVCRWATAIGADVDALIAGAASGSQPGPLTP